MSKYIPTKEEWEKWKDLDYYPYPRFRCQCSPTCSAKIPVRPSHRKQGIPLSRQGHPANRRKGRGKYREKPDVKRKCLNPFCNTIMVLPWWDKRKYCKRDCYLDERKRPRAFITKPCPYCGKQIVVEYQVKNGIGGFHVKYCPGHNPKNFPPRSPETKEKIRKANSGKKRTEETRENMGKARRKLLAEGWWWHKYDLPEKLVPIMRKFFETENWDEILKLLRQHKVALLDCFIVIGYMNGASTGEMAKMLEIPTYMVHGAAHRFKDRIPGVNISLPTKGKRRVGPNKSSLLSPDKLSIPTIEGDDWTDWWAEGLRSIF